MTLRWIICCFIAIGLTACASSQEDYSRSIEADEAAKARLEEKWNPLSQLSIPELERRTAAGDTEAQAELGARYGKGDGVEQDLDKAIEILKDAAEKGEPGAEFFLGTAYFSGLGVPRSEVGAIMWFEKAAKKGHAPAQYWLAVLIKDGRGGIVNPNWDAAVPLLWESAMQEYPDAQFLLGYAYQMGLGVEQNIDAAAYWYRRTLSQEKHIRALFNLGVLIKEGKVALRSSDPEEIQQAINTKN